jgi:hypothetical protein
MMVEFLWAVEVTEPPTEGRQWTRPRRFLVVAPTLEEAVVLTRKRFPDITFIKIMRDRNVDDVLIDARP